MAETMSEYYKRKADEDRERREAQHALTMANRRSEIARSPGSFNPWEKRTVDDYYRQKEDARRFDASQQTARGQWGYTDEYGVHHAGGAEKVAEYDWMGKRDAGSTAAGINAEATKYGADKTLAGIQAQAQSALEIAKQKAEAEKWIAGRNAQVSEENSKREWGFWDKDDYFNEGGRVAQAQAQGEAAAKIAEQNNQARIEQERIKAQAKTTAAAMAKDTRIAAAIGGNQMLANNPKKAQEMLEALAGAGLSAEEAAEIIERRNKQQGDKKGGLSEVEKFNIRAGESVDTGEVNARSKQIRNTYQQRGMGV